MNEGPSQGLNLHALGLLDNKGGGNSGGQGMDKANEQETPELIVEGINKVPGNLAKMLEAIPLIGSLLSSLVPTNAGEVGVFASVNRESFIDKSINQGKGGTQGGVLYNAIGASLIKNSKITDQTGGSGGDVSGGGGGGGGGSFVSAGSDGGTGGFALGSQAQFSDMMGAVASSMTSQSWGDLGTLTPLVTPNNAVSRGAGMEMS